MNEQGNRPQTYDDPRCPGTYRGKNWLKVPYIINAEPGSQEQGGGGCLWALGTEKDIDRLKAIWEKILSEREKMPVFWKLPSTIKGFFFIKNLNFLDRYEKNSAVFLWKRSLKKITNSEIREKNVFSRYDTFFAKILGKPGMCVGSALRS